MGDTPETTKKTVKILVVEDSPTQLEQLRFLLEEAGYLVVAATNGREGFAAAKANAIELVISDIMMPEMDGYALCKALRADETLRHLPVILLTALADPRDVIHGLESGANNFICKPFDDRALLARVQNVLTNQEIRKATPSEMGINIFFAGKQFFITADRLQILDLLLSTYENAVDRNSELIRTRDELRILNEQLEVRVAERTAALAASETRYRRLFEAAKDGILILDADTGRIVDVNPFLMELTGYPREEFLQRHLWLIGPFKNIAPSEGSFVDLQTKHYVRYDDIPLETRDGRKIDVEFVSNVYRVDNQRVIQFSIRDITERKQAEEALRESETRFRGLFENSLTAISTAEPGGRLIQANLAYAQMYGYGSVAEMMAEVPNVASLYANPEERNEVLRILTEKGVMEPREMQVVRRDGTRLVVLATAREIRDATGNLLFYEAEHVDITARKRAEEAIKSQLEELQRWQEVMLGREDRVQEVKREVNELCRRLGEKTRYSSQEEP